MKPTVLLSTRALARRADVDARTVQSRIRAGLITPSATDGSGRPLFALGDVEIVKCPAGKTTKL
jgi:DNA-binding transcriptional MerR regulator